MNDYVVGEMVFIDLEGAIGDEEQSDPEGRACVILYVPPKMGICLRLVVVVPLTRISHSWNTVVQLEADSYALCHQIRVVSIKRIRPRLGEKEVMDRNKLYKIKTVLANMFGF